MNKKIIKILFLLFLFFSFSHANEQQKKIAYIVSDLSIPFWKIMSKGIESKSKELGYKVEFYSSNNLKKIELENLSKALSSKVDGLIISPINSSTAVTFLEFAKKSNLPVVISDIGTDSGEYLSFISSDNITGAYELGKILTKRMKELNFDKEGSVGIIAIPQKRQNGKDRTIGFFDCFIGIVSCVVSLIARTVKNIPFTIRFGISKPLSSGIETLLFTMSKSSDAKFSPFFKHCFLIHLFVLKQSFFE